MRSWIGYAVAVLAVLGLPGSGAGAVEVAYSPSWDPEFVVGGDGRSSYGIALYDRAKWNQRVAVETDHWVVYVPRGFQVDTTLPLGARIGVALGDRFANTGHITQLGDVVVADPAVGSTRACLQGAHDAFWRMPTRTSSSLDGDVIVAVDRIVEGAEARFAAYRLTVCPPPVPGDAEVHFIVDMITSPPVAGAYVWRAVYHPTSYTGAALPQPVEARSLVRLPIRIALSAKRFVATVTVAGKVTRQRKVLITGRVTENGRAPVQGNRDREGYYSVSLYRRTERNGRDEYLGDLGVGTSGRFQVVVRDRRGTYYRVGTIDLSTANGRPAPRSLCDRPWLAPGGCVRPTLWDFFVDGPIVRAR